jgi:HK97 family phage portal protein
MSKFIDWLTGESYKTSIVDEIIANAPTQPLEKRDAPSIPPPGYVARTPGAPVTIETALSLSVVYRSVSVLATIISQLELTVSTVTGKPLKTLPDRIARPDYQIPLSEFLKKTVTSLATYGNAYWRLWRTTETAMPDRLEVLNPNSVSIEYDADDNKVYVYKGRNGNVVRLQPWQVSHLKLMVSFETNVDYGSGPIQRCAEEIQHALDLRDYARRVFDEYPSGIVSVEGYLDEDMRAEYKAAWYAEQVNGERIKFIGNKASYQQLEQNPETTQYVSAQRLADAKVARAFGMPPNMVLVEDVSNKTYQNLQDVDRAFIRNTVEEYLTVIESAFSDLLFPKTVKFNTDAWLRALTVDTPATQINEGGPVDESQAPTE